MNTLWRHDKFEYWAEVNVFSLSPENMTKTYGEKRKSFVGFHQNGKKLVSKLLITGILFFCPA